MGRGVVGCCSQVVVKATFKPARDAFNNKPARHLFNDKPARHLFNDKLVRHLFKTN